MHRMWVTHYYYGGVYMSIKCTACESHIIIMVVYICLFVRLWLSPSHSSALRAALCSKSSRSCHVMAHCRHCLAVRNPAFPCVLVPVDLSGVVDVVNSILMFFLVNSILMFFLVNSILMFFLPWSIPSLVYSACTDGWSGTGVLAAGALPWRWRM